MVWRRRFGVGRAMRMSDWDVVGFLVGFGFWRLGWDVFGNGLYIHTS